MTSDRGQRNRELIEKSAALLAADYPFDVLIERLCDAIADGMHATVSVALPNDDGTVRLYYLNERGRHRETHDQLMPEDSPVAQVFRTGQSLIMHDAPEGIDDRLRSAIHAPISYGDSILGVLSVEHRDAAEFTRDDLRVVESLARHLAISIRNQRSLSAVAMPARHPWLAHVAIALVVLVGTILALTWMNARISDARAVATEERLEHAGRLASVVNRALGGDAQLANMAASVAGPVRNDPLLATTLLARMLHARENQNVDRLGIFYEPVRGSARRSGFYVEADTRRRVRAVGRYMRSPWYRDALGAGGNATAVRPYDDNGTRYLGAAQMFFDGSRPAGVVTAETDLALLIDRLRSELPPGTHMSIIGAAGQTIAQTGAVSIDRAASITVPLHDNHWTLEYTESSAPLLRRMRATEVAAVVAIALLWAGGIFAAIALRVFRRTRQAAAGLKIQRAQLQSEIASRIDVEEQLRAAAYHDTLTGLPNRAFFLNQLADVLEQRRMTPGGEYAVLFIDLDRFYVVNDSMGHGMGDQLLSAIAYRLEETIPPHALVARLGGDEFVLLLPALGGALKEAVVIAEDILEALRNPFTLGEREVYSGASIGIVKIDDTYADSETILRDADIAMYHAKRSGRARYAVFDRAMRERVTQQTELEGSLRGAVDRGEIVAFYQPIVSVADAQIVGFEALARWHRDGETQTVSASDFVPVAELTGMMRAIDAELFAQVCRDVSELTAIAPGVRVSVNVSANDLTRASLLADIDSTLERFSVSTSAFRIEITETAVMEDAERALAMLGELRARGLEIVVDDFGAGYSSLSYLQRLPLAGVKIDRSFIVALPGNEQALEIVRAIVALAKTLGLHVTAEGVERKEQFDLLRQLGVDYAQGYWFSPPVNFETAKTLFAVRS